MKNKKKEKTSTKTNKYLNSKNIVILIVASVLIISLGYILTHKNLGFIGEPNLKINYGKGQTIELSNITEKVPYTNEVTVTNNTDKDIVYSVSWVKVSNSFQEQNKLLYTIDTHDAGALFVGKSQIPVADASFPEVTIKAKEKHTYTISVYFEGDSIQEKNSVFKGSIEIKEV
ncbi:MAG: hypothetical protein IJL74_01880 [Bacilli bacterium]|nr:hypothetical protein [Bacilli bacterium]